MKKNFFVGLLFLTLSGFAQVQDALVFFADKENVQDAIDNPLTILTQEAIDRKALHNTPIDERDVPVTEDYISQVKNAVGVTVWAKSKWLNCVYVQGTEANIEALMDLSFVTGIEWMDKSLNFPQPLGNTPDKFQIENQRINYDYGSAANQIEMIRGDFLHEQEFTGEGMVLAIMDSGFPNFAANPGFSHIIDDNRLLGTFDFFSRTSNVTGSGSHGIMTTSTLGGLLAEAYVGTAPDASLYLFRTEYAVNNEENPREEAWWVEALERADSLGVDVVNTSLGYQDYDNPNYTHTYEDLDGMTTISARGANIAFEKGMLLVTSAGNDGNGFGTVATPADAPGVLSIGAVDADQFYASFSSRGPTVDGRVKPDVMAQGQGAAVIDVNGEVDFRNGTSFSSPIIAGAITCLWQSRPEIKNAEVMQVVRESAHLFNTPNNEMGYGIPNFETAYNALQLLGNEQTFLTGNFAVYPNPVRDILNISFPETVTKAQIEVFNVLGEKVFTQTVSSQLRKVNLSLLNSGVYIARITSEKANNSFKIIKQ